MLLVNFIVTRKKSSMTSEHTFPNSELIARMGQHSGSEAYASMFALEPRENFEGYEGPTYPSFGRIWLDLDSKGDDGRRALIDTRALLMDLELPEVAVFFSGGKGFHLGIPWQYLDETPGLGFHDKVHALAKGLKEKFKSVDSGIYNSVRKFRLPFSQHDQSGLYKIFIPTEEFLALTHEEILERAKHRGTPSSFEAPDAGVARAPHAKLMSYLQVKRFAQNEPKAGGSVEEDPSTQQTFEMFQDKKCIARMFESNVTGERHYTALRLITDHYNARVPQPLLEKKIGKWLQLNGLSANDPGTVELIGKVYGGQVRYSFGCNDTIKAQFCSGKCGLYRQLAPANRPEVRDAPKALQAEARKEKLPSEQKIAEALLEKLGEDIIRQDKSLFRYTGTHWKELFSVDIDKIKNQINRLYDEEAESKRVDSAFRTLVRNIPSVPDGVNLYNPMPTAASFTNGTLHAFKGQGREWRFEFRPHNRLDFVVNVLPYEYKENDKSSNQEFDSMLERVFEGDHDKDEKIRALAQMYGACLMPIYPHFWFLVGAPGTGKSTAIKLAKKLVSEENTCSVDPTEFEGFNLESMLGKLVNYDTDVNTTDPINDAKLKKIEDGIPFRVRRKGIADAYGVLPATHIFGGNDIPPTIEGSSRAHNRRWTFMGFDKVLTDRGDYDREFDQIVWDAGPQAIIQFAVRGLKDTLLNRGLYLNPASGKVKMEEWQAQSDPVGLFLEDIAEGEVVDSGCTVYLAPEAKISSRILFSIFKQWGSTSGVDLRSWSNRKFFKGMAARGYEKYRSHGCQAFKGFQVEGRVENNAL